MPSLSTISTQNNINFGRISIASIRQANQACIDKTRLAKIRGLTLGEYRNLHQEDYIKKIGNKIYDFRTIAKKILANKENFEKICCEAWDKVIGKR